MAGIQNVSGVICLAVSLWQVLSGRYFVKGNNGEKGAKRKSKGIERDRLGTLEGKKGNTW